MDEVTLYNLHATAAGAGLEASRDAKKYAGDLMIIHLHLEHKIGIRELAKRFNRKMVEIKALLYPHLISPEPDWRDVERAKKRGRKMVWNFEKQIWKTEPIKA